MSRLPRLTGQKVGRALRKAGFVLMRQRGSHLFLKHPDGRTTVIPIHGNEVLGPGLMSKILRDTELTREEFLNLL